MPLRHYWKFVKWKEGSLQLCSTRHQPSKQRRILETRNCGHTQRSSKLSDMKKSMEHENKRRWLSRTGGRGRVNLIDKLIWFLSTSRILIFVLVDDAWKYLKSCPKEHRVRYRPIHPPVFIYLFICSRETTQRNQNTSKRKPQHGNKETQMHLGQAIYVWPYV